MFTQRRAMSFSILMFLLYKLYRKSWMGRNTELVFHCFINVNYLVGIYFHTNKGKCKSIPRKFLTSSRRKACIQNYRKQTFFRCFSDLLSVQLPNWRTNLNWGNHEVQKAEDTLKWTNNWITLFWPHHLKNTKFWMLDSQKMRVGWSSLCSDVSVSNRSSGVSHC